MDKGRYNRRKVNLTDSYFIDFRMTHISNVNQPSSFLMNSDLVCFFIKNSLQAYHFLLSKMTHIALTSDSVFKYPFAVSFGYLFKIQATIIRSLFSQGMDDTNPTTDKIHTNLSITLIFVIIKQL